MSTKKIFPKFKKSVTQFISEEDGFVTKAQVAKVIVGAALVGTIGHSIASQAQAFHTSYNYWIYSGHVNVAGINQPSAGRMDQKANGHVNGVPPSGHLNAPAINKPGYGEAHANHAQHGSHGSCGGGCW
jgi:hypothetical protein